ncbi:MAG: sulfatase [Actinobacteria bacterium]|nr:sulfatase [Actinomycetota bacterium]
MSSRFAMRCFVFSSGFLLLAAPSSALAQVGDLVAIRATASDLAARSDRLRSRAAADYQAEALAAIRRACASRGVTRLDEIAPASVTSEADDDAAPPLFVIDYGAEKAQGLSPPLEAVDANTELETSGRALLLRSGQVRTTTAFALVRESVGTIELEVVTTAPGHLLLGWSDEADAPRLRRNNARVELVGDGRVHTYAVNAADALARGIASGAALRRFFIATRGEAPLEIRALRVLPPAARFAGASHGATHEARGSELRSVLWMKPPTALTFEVDVPAADPVLETGLALLAGDGIAEFEVAVQDGEARTVLAKRLVKSAPWEDLALELAPWTGRRVVVSLAVRGSRDAVALWSSPLVRPRAGDEHTKPFVLLLEDALRADRLSLYGGPVPVPGHERLAASGVVFERAFAQSTQTRSSVPSMMTSLLPSATGTWDFSDALSDRYVTLAEALRACGFATASFLQNGNAGRYAGLAQGFDVVFDEESFGGRAADLLAADSPLETWISRQRGRPYFAYVHVLDPHGPYDPVARPDLSAAEAGEEIARDRAVDAAWLERPTAAARRLLYDAEIAANDVALTGFLDRLEARGDLERAVVAVVADHGEFLGEHGGLWRHHPPGHVEVARVPFILRTPAATPRRVAEPVALLDLMPSLLEMAGVDASALVMHGDSLAQVAAGKGLPKLAERAVPADEMILEQGERRARGCGSFATATSLWLLSCTRDEDFTPGRPLPLRGPEPAPLRLVGLRPDNLGTEAAAGFGHTVLEGVSRSALISLQSSNMEAWKRITAAAAARIVSDPLGDERLRALGYME